jgi:hypothetical protein
MIQGKRSSFLSNIILKCDLHIKSILETRNTFHVTDNKKFWLECQLWQKQEYGCGGCRYATFCSTNSTIEFGIDEKCADCFSKFKCATML